MPYRRLPNTDAARIAALEKAVSMEYKQSPAYQPATFKTLNEARIILPRLKAAVTQFRYNYDRLGKCSKEFQPLVKTARLYISHFIQVLNMAVIRNEIKAEYKTLYGLDVDDFTVPDLMSEQAICDWGKRIIEGENIRISRRGGSPIYNPTIAKVKVHYDLFTEMRYSRDSYRLQMQRSMQQLATLREEVDRIILDIWNQVEEYFTVHAAEARYNRCREYGVIYYLRKNEKQAE